MSVFFGGRQLISPTSMSAINDSGLANKNLSVGNTLALIGQSAGGKPNTALRFGSPSEAIAALRSGELLDAVKKAFNPSNETGGPAVVVAIRVNPATQSTLTLKDGTAADAIVLSSTDYGLYTNQIKVKVESGSSAGKKVTTQLGNDYYAQDNLARNAFSIQYSGGQASATMTVSNTTLTLAAPLGNTVATIDLATYPTVQQLVDRINAVTGFTASVTDGNGATATLNALDSVTAQDVRTALYTATANLQAVIDWLNGNAEGFVTATRATNAGAMPANIGFTYLSGGVDGTVTNTEWSNAFTTLQAQDVQWVVPVSSDASIAAMADAHVQYMSGVGKMERRAICGMALSSSDSAAITAAKALNSDRTSLAHVGYYDYNAAGVLTLYPPYMLAAAVGGMFAGVSPGTPLTNKAIKVVGLERALRNPTDTDPLIQAGVLCVESTAKGFKIVKSISTWLVNQNYNRVEQSTGVALDYTARSVRDALDVLRGQKGNSLVLQRAVSIADSTLRQLSVPDPNGPGVLVGDALNPPYKNITASLNGDVLSVQYQCQPVIGVNYVLQTVYANIFTGTASA